MTIRIRPATLVSGIIFWLLTSVPALGSSHTWLLTHVLTPNSPKGKALQYFAREIETASQGAITIRIHDSARLYDDAEGIAALQFGAVHFLAPTTTKITPLVPALALLDIPFLFETREAYYALLAGPFGEYLREQLSLQDIRLLAFWDNGFKQISNSIGKVSYPEDLQGFSIRVMSGTDMSRYYQRYGATAIDLSFREMRQLIRLGAVDGAENTVINFANEDLAPLQPYLTLTNHGLMVYLFIMRESHYRSLSEAQQQIVDEAVRHATEHIHHSVVTEEANALEQLWQNEALQITNLTPGQRRYWRTKVKPVASDFLATLPESIRKLIEAKPSEK
ncbi:DctP family TRAP transporter solute-binding subunit [Chrysiogenes arsenatis]|uniref:DctP family TRAP transporter solute-binding subunit n=1 Tax=Chrysiogenes arsenatis TaxID=309797 RepID=UPI0003F75E7C|nr:DctP family TRAP transporter solute-binding subunit [Chrysiogenes arsenatis]